jgi:hypothetical protein
MGSDFLKNEASSLFSTQKQLNMTHQKSCEATEACGGLTGLLSAARACKVM